MERILTVEGLQVEFQTRRGSALAVDGIDLTIDRGEVLGVVGESGCGKSVTAQAIMRLIDYPGRIVGGRIDLGGQDVLSLSSAEMQRLRGAYVSMIFQDPGTALNPVLRIGDQIEELFKHHRVSRRSEMRERAVELLTLTGISAPRQRLRQYPHQMSGGMQQRVAIAIAIALEPKLLIADEPTTALDVTIQAEILEVLRGLQRDQGMAMMLISHDVGVVAQNCRRVAVMYAGKVIESGTAENVIERPAHPYTQGLIEAVPRLEDARNERLRAIPGSVPDIVQPPSGCRFHPRCRFATELCRTVAPPTIALTPDHAVACHLYESREGAPTREANAAAPAVPAAPAAGAGASTGRASHGDRAGRDTPTAPVLRVEQLTKTFPVGWRREGNRLRRKWVRAVADVSFEVSPGEGFALVGESGCGKSTTARVIMGLHKPTGGRVIVADRDLGTLSAKEMFNHRSLFQTVFQNPYASLDPRWTVEQLVAEPLRVHGRASGGERRKQVLELLSSVSLGRMHLGRYPHQLSGGQRQRVAIARALALEPRLLVADEPMSALDVSIQAQILNLMIDLKDHLHLSFLFISHNLAVVPHLCERVGVMYAGGIVETGPTKRVLHAPRHPYTQMLISSVPELAVQPPARRIVATGEPPSPLEQPVGCPFASRCRFARDICWTEVPRPVALGDGHSASCHMVASGEVWQS